MPPGPEHPADRPSHRALPPPRRLAVLVFFVCIAPSALLFFFPIYEEDVPTHIFSQPFGFAAWLRQGRPVWNLLHLATPPAWRQYPAICIPLASVYTAFYAAFTALLGMSLSRLMRAPRAAWFATAFICLHFFLLEGRVWMGHFMLLGADIQLAGFLAAWRWRARPWRVVGILAASTFLALNTHQGGAFVLVALMGLGAAEMVLTRTDRSDSPRRFWKAVALGFVLACVLYACQMLAVRATLGMQTRRLGGDILGNAAGVARNIALLAAVPLPWFVWEARWACLPMTASAAALVFLLPRGVPWRRRAAALALVATGAFATTAPVIATDGYASSRVLTPVLVGLWGGAALVLTHWHRGRRSAWVRGLLIAALAMWWLVHFWSFALFVAIRNEDLHWTERLHREMAELDARPGERVEIPGATCYNSPLIGWGDTGRTIYAAAWGAEAMLRARNFGQTPLPANLQPKFLADAPLPVEMARWGHPGLAARLPDGRLVVNSNLVVGRQLELEYLFTHPRRRRSKRPLGTLAFLGIHEIRAADGASSPSQESKASFWGWDREIYLTPPPGGAYRIYIGSAELDRQWRLRARVSADGRSTVGPVARAGLRLPDGSDRVLESETLRPGADSERLRAEGDPQPGAMLWVEVATPQGTPPQAWAQVHWRDARLEMEFPECPG